MEQKDLIANAYDVFAGFDKPACCTMHHDDPESIDHNKTLENIARHQLTIRQIGPVGYSPIPILNPEAMAYFMPRLIEFAVTNESDIDGDPFIVRFINVVLGGPGDTRFQLLESPHRKLILQTLLHIKEHSQKIVSIECWEDELDTAIEKWQKQ